MEENQENIDQNPNQGVSLEEPQAASKEDIANIIQALIFASPELLTIRKLKELIGDFVDTALVRDCLQITNNNLNAINSPFELVEHGGGFRFRTRTKFYPWVRKLFPDHNNRRLSQAALETLAIVAYKQPITKAEVESVRGVSCDGPLRSLLEKKMIGLGGRSDSAGGAFYYVTTKEFLSYFGINRIPEDLPRMSELDNLLSAGELVPQLRGGELLIENQDDIDPNQVEMSIGEN